MPAIVGVVNIVNISSSAVMNIGDVYSIAPISTAKTFAGAGSFNTGDHLVINNQYNQTTTYESDFVDQPIIGI